MDDGYDDSISACWGKIAFDSARMAKTVAKRRSRSGKKGEAYRCPHCRYWHIGRKQRLKKPEKDHANAETS